MEGKNIVNKILFSDNDLDLIKNNTHDIKDIISKNFNGNLIYLKIIFLVLFIVMASINKYTNFIKKKPIAFGIETVSYGIIGSIPFLHMEQYRRMGSDKHYLKIFLIMFSLYCLFNVLFEVSGFYSYMYEEDEEKVHETICEKEPSKNETLFNNFNLSFTITFIIVILYMIFILFLITYEVYDFDIVGYRDNIFKLFGNETILFALCNAIPFLFIAFNRQGFKFKLGNNLLEIFILIIKFIIFHVILQGSGFYKIALGY
jgi:hypothetical protein